MPNAQCTQPGTSCRKVTVVRNQLRLGSLYGAYEKKKTAVEELTDKWISMLRRKATIKRKQVRLSSAYHRSGRLMRAFRALDR